MSAAPTAALNPETGSPFGDKQIYEVFRTSCYDDGVEEPWGHIVPYRKTALSQAAQKFHYNWACAELRLNRSPAWYYQRVVLASVVLPDRLR